MGEESDISARYDEIRAAADRVLTALKRKLADFLYDSSVEDVREASEDLDFSPSSWSKGRIKSCSSVIRKAGELGIEDASRIPEAIEDFIGIRVATKNKATARVLFEDMRNRYYRDDWFCESEGDAVFDAKTFAEAKPYAIKSGYQAFHINFLHHSRDRYHQECDVSLWPIEIQVMSQLWTFYAEFSRRYFYKPDDPAPEHLAPYVIPLSKILDSADDLVSIILEAKSDFAAQSEEYVEEERVSIDSIQQWLSGNERLKRFYGTDKMPKNVFLLKISSLLQEQGLTEDMLEEIMSSENLQERYMDIIAGSPGLYFLPPWQKTLAFVLMNTGSPDSEVVAKVNDELWHRPDSLRTPPQEKQHGQVLFYDSDTDRGGVAGFESRLLYSFRQQSLESPITRETLTRAVETRETVIFTLRRIHDKFVVVSIETESQ